MAGIRAGARCFASTSGEDANGRSRATSAVLLCDWANMAARKYPKNQQAGCLQCGETFTIKFFYPSVQKYCRRQCADLSKRVFPHGKQCSRCGRNFDAVNDSREQRFCSISCSTSGTRRRRVVVPCRDCGRSIRSVTGKKRCRACLRRRAVALSRQRKGSNALRWRRNCGFCGKKLDKPWRSRARRLWCSRDCGHRDLVLRRQYPGLVGRREFILARQLSELSRITIGANWRKYSP